MSSSFADNSKLEAIYSLEDSQNKLAKSEKSWIRRPVAMICLAISMGTSGILLSQNKPAIATNSVTANANVAITNLPNFSDLHREESKLSPLALKYKVQEGDTIPEFLTKSAIAKHRSFTGRGFEQSERGFT